MDSYDPEKAARVWQRVRSDEPVPQPEDDLTPLIGQLQLDGATYLNFSRQAGSREAATLKRLATEKQAQAACLKGIHLLTTGRKCILAASQIPKVPHYSELRRCYSNEQYALSQFELRSADRDFGAVFAELAKEQRRHCITVLELIGRWGR